MQPSCLGSGVSLGALPAAKHDGQAQRGRTGGQQNWRKRISSGGRDEGGHSKGCGGKKNKAPTVRYLVEKIGAIKWSIFRIYI